MAYVPTVWENDITEVDEDNMNHIEEGIKNNDDKLQGLTSMGSIVVDSIRSKNMFNVNSFIGGVLNINTGEIEDLTGATITSINSDTGTISFTNTRSWRGVFSEFIEVEQNKEYTLSLTSNNDTLWYIVLFYDNSKNFVSVLLLKNSIAPDTDYNFTIPSGVKYARFLLESSTNTTTPANITLSNIQLELESTSTNFTPYQGLGYESGNNASGNYIKYNDGTLIQWGKINKEPFLQPNDIYTTVQSIKWYRSDPPSVQFPISFINTAYTLNITINTGTDGVRFAIPRISSKLSSYFQLQLISVEPFTSSGTGYTNLIDVEWIAIGNWK